jgi:hypothetical protein
MRLFRSRKDEAPVEPEPPPITWPAALAGTALDVEARRRLIADLELVGAPWCMPFLERAVEEEQGEGLRDAASRALARCREQRF